MGCDIHMFAEKRADKNSPWETTGKIFKNPYWSPDRPNTIDEYGFEWNPEFTLQPYKGRNYDLFSILADVRNGEGFAGIKTGEGFVPIAEPKGFPIDACQETIKEYALVLSDDYSLQQFEGWVESGYSDWVEYGKSVTSPDWHSASWFTVQELLDYDWHQITLKQGYIHISEYQKLKEEGGTPACWSGMISGMNITRISEEDADKMVESGTIDNGAHVLYRWAIKYSDHCKGFIEETIPTLQAIGDPENVRIVFWFDN